MAFDYDLFVEGVYDPKQLVSILSDSRATQPQDLLPQLLDIEAVAIVNLTSCPRIFDFGERGQLACRTLLSFTLSSFPTDESGLSGVNTVLFHTTRLLAYIPDQAALIENGDTMVYAMIDKKLVCNRIWAGWGESRLNLLQIPYTVSTIEW